MQWSDSFLFFFLDLRIFYSSFFIFCYHESMGQSKKPLKVVLFAPYFSPHRGGLEHYSALLAKYLVKKGVEVLVVTSRFERENKEEENGYIILRLKSWDLLGGRYPIPLPSLENFYLLRKAKFFRPHIIITQTRFFIFSFLGWFLSKRWRIPYVHIEHGSNFPVLKGLAGWIARCWDRTLGRSILRQAREVIAISQAVARFVFSLSGRKAIVIPNSVECSSFPVKTWKRSTPRIIFVGRLIEAKGVQDFIRVFKKVSVRYPHWELRIIGDGFFRKTLENMAGNKRIKFEGEKNLREVKKYLKNSEILVNPSYAEGLPTCVLEAGAVGLAVIATDVGGTREIVEDNKNGYLFNSGDRRELRKKLLSLLANRRLREKFGQALQEKVRKEFDWQKNVEKIIEVLQRCIN